MSDQEIPVKEQEHHRPKSSILMVRRANKRRIRPGQLLHSHMSVRGHLRPHLSSHLRSLRIHGQLTPQELDRNGRVEGSLDHWLHAGGAGGHGSSWRSCSCSCCSLAERFSW